MKLELFQQLPQSQLNWICDRATKIQLAKGVILVREGDPHRGFFILVAGTMGITRLKIFD